MARRHGKNPGRNRNFAIFDLEKFRDQILNADGSTCTIHFLSGTSRAMILSCLRYAEFFSRWHVDNELELGQLTDLERDEVEGLIADSYLEILMGCDAGTLAQQIALLRGAITGETVDVENLQTTGTRDFSTDALEPKLEEIRAILETMSTSGDEVEAIMNGIIIALGGVPV